MDVQFELYAKWGKRNFEIRNCGCFKFCRTTVNTYNGGQLSYLSTRTYKA